MRRALDEPTNRLDIPTREAIEAALRSYPGAIIYASHDAYFTRTLGAGQLIDFTLRP